MTDHIYPTRWFERRPFRLGVVDVKIAAIDDDWTGQRVVWRVEHRAGR